LSHHEHILKHCEHVFRAMGTGHTEKVYHNALLIEFQLSNIPYRSEVMCPYFYKGIVTGYGTADVVVYNTILELKANNHQPKQHGLQLKKYVNSLKMDGMLINFNQKTGNIEHTRLPYSI